MGGARPPVQRRLANGLPQLCTEAAATATGYFIHVDSSTSIHPRRFIHVEQRRVCRTDPDAYGALIAAIKAAF
jgi:hypothetical protein